MEPKEPPPPGLSRRGFVKGVATTAGIATVATFWFDGLGDPARRRRIEPTRAGAPLQRLTETDFRTLEALADRILPSSGPASPGARDVNAAGYIDAVLAHEPIPEELVDRTLAGLPKAEAWAQERHGRAFHELDTAAQDAIVALYHRTPEDTRFLRFLVELVLECFFGDPVHGGNLDELGWRWIGHRPGSPRPSRKGWRPREIR